MLIRAIREKVKAPVYVVTKVRLIETLVESANFAHKQDLYFFE